MSEYKDGFELHAETLIEGAQALEQTGDSYDKHLAYEMLLALEESEVIQERYEHLQEKLYNE